MSRNHYEIIENWHQEFIGSQHMFFVATAGPGGRINMAPKDAPSLKVLGPKRIVWVNLTGAENETGAHLAESPRMTLMWCSFGRKPMILRAYGVAKLIHPRDQMWSELIDLFPHRYGSRQIIDLTVDLVLKSCGFGVPLYDFVSHRDTLQRWEETKDRQGVHEFWKERNQVSIDGKRTKLFDDE